MGFCFVLALCVWLILWLIFLLIVTHVCFLQQQATQKYLLAVITLDMVVIVEEL